MSSRPGDLVGFLAAEAVRLLEEQGYEVVVRSTGPRVTGRGRVVRQRLLGARVVEVVVGYEMYPDLAQGAEEGQVLPPKGAPGGGRAGEPARGD